MIKEIADDSFGNTTGDTLPQLFFPLGFAGGLVDPHAGFIRFGFRDYDPATGRFTARDPLGDTGGDHDLYDYCVDDPVSFVDPQGLFAKRVTEREWKEAEPPRDEPGRFAEKDEETLSNNKIEDKNEDNEAGWWRRNFFWYTLPDTHPVYQAQRKMLIRDVGNVAESWGRNMLGTHLRTINGRTRGVSDAIINKNATAITDQLLTDIAEEALTHGRTRRK